MWNSTVLQDLGIRDWSLQDPWRIQKPPLQFSWWENWNPSISKAGLPRGTSDRFRCLWLHLGMSLVQVASHRCKEKLYLLLSDPAGPAWVFWQCQGVTHWTLKLYTHDTFTALKNRKLVCTILFHLKSWKYQLKTFHAADVKHLLLKSLWCRPWVVGFFSLQGGYIIIWALDPLRRISAAFS